MRTTERTAKITRIGLLAAIASVLYYIEIPFLVGFYKIDLSGIPAVLAGFTMGPIPALIVIAIKNILHLAVSQTMVVGEIADFVMLSTLVLTATFIYRRKPGFRSALLGLCLGSALMTLVAALMNYFVLIPFYIRVFSGFMSEASVVADGAAVFPIVNSLGKFVLFITVPFNLLKCLLVSGLSLILQKHLGPLLSPKRGGAEAAPTGGK